MSDQELQNSETDIRDRQASKLEAALLDPSSTVDPKESGVASLKTSTNRSPAHSPVGDMNQPPATDTSPLVTTNTAQPTADVDQPTSSDPKQFASKDATASAVSGSSEEFGSVETTETNIEEQDQFKSPDSSGGASQTASALDETVASNPEVDEQNGGAAGDSGAHHLTDAAAEINISVPQTADPVGDSRASANPDAKDDRQNIPSVGLPVLKEDPTAEEEEEEERAKENSVKAAAEPKTTKAAVSIIHIEPPSEEDFDASLEPNPVNETPSEQGKDPAQSGDAVPVEPEARRRKKTSGVEGSRDPVEQTADKAKVEADQEKKGVTLKRTAESEKEATRETAATRSAKNGSAVKAEEKEPLFTVGETEPQSRSSQKESPTKGKKSRARRVRSPRRGDEIQATNDSQATNPKKRHHMMEDRNSKSGMAEGPGRESSQPREAGRWMAQTDPETSPSPHPPAFHHFAGLEEHDTRAVTRSNQKARNLQVWQTMKRFTCLGQVAGTSDVDRYKNVRLDFLYRLVEFVSNLCLAGTEVILGRSAVHRLDIFLANVLRSILSSGKLLRRTCLYHGGVTLISDCWRSRVGRPIIRATGYLARSVENVLTVVDEMYVELGLTPGEAETIREQGLVKLAVRAWCFPAYCYVYLWAMLLNLVHSSQLYFRDTLPRKLHSRKRSFHDTQYDQDEFWKFTFRREDGSDDDDQEGRDYGSLRRRRQGGRKDSRPDHQWTGSGQNGDRQHAEGPERSEERRGEGTQRVGYPERDSSETHRSGEGRQQTETSSDLRRRHRDYGKSHGYHGNGIKSSGQRSVEKYIEEQRHRHCGLCGDTRIPGPFETGSVDSGRTDDHGGCSGYAWLPRHKLLSGYYPEPWKTRSGRPVCGRTDESETYSEFGTLLALEREYEYIVRANHAIAELRPIQERDWYTSPEPPRISPDPKQCDMECCQRNPPRSSARTSPMRAITKASPRVKGDRTSTPQKHDARSEAARKPRSTFERDYDKGDDFYEDALCSDNDDYMTISVDRDVRTVTVPEEDEEEQTSGHYYRLRYPVKKEARDVHDSDEEEVHVSKPGEEDGRTPGSQPKVSFRSHLAHKPPKPAPGRDNQDHEDVPATRRGVKEANSSKGRKITPIKRRLAGARGATSLRPFRLLVPPSSYEATKFEDLSVGNQLLCLMRKMPLLSNVLRDPRDPPPVSYLYDVPTVIRDDDTRRLLEMAPRRRTSKELKRKLDEVYPEDASDDPDYQPEDLDTTDPLEYTEDDAAGVSDEEEYVTHIVDVEVHAEAEPARGRPRNRDNDDESDGVKYESEGSDGNDIVPKK